jgi:hypothetical protein
MWLELVIDFINSLQIGTTCNYKAIANLHTLQITTAHDKSFQSAGSSPVIPW